MRAADVAAGGQGAPLVPVYHRALAAGLTERPVAFVNIGGVANMTWIGQDGELVAFDTGPGNALLNDWCERHTDVPFDRDGALAARGRVATAVLGQLLNHLFCTARAQIPRPQCLRRSRCWTACRRKMARQHSRISPPQPSRAACGLCRNVRSSRSSAAADGSIHADARPAGSSSSPWNSQRKNLGLNGDSMEAEAWAYLAVRCLEAADHLPRHHRRSASALRRRFKPAA